MIDIVISYVNFKDLHWQNDFKKYYEGQIDLCRFNRLDLLPYVFKSIDKFAKFDIGNIYIVVSHKSEVPQYILEQYPKIIPIEHKDIIPEEYLPIFNASIIELFLYRIPNLSDQFLYFMDDVILIKEVTEQDFFVDNKNISQIFLNRYHKNHLYFSDFDIMMKNIEKNVFGHNLINEDTILYLDHGPSPFFKHIWEKIFELYGDIIYSNITRFKSNRNICQSIYHYYHVKTYGEYKPNYINKYVLLHKNMDWTTNELLYSLYGKNNFGYACINYTEDSKINSEELPNIQSQIYNILDIFYDNV